MSPWQYLAYGILASLTVAAVFGIFVWMLSKTNLPKRAIEIISIVILILGLSSISYLGDVMHGVIYATRR